MTLAESGQVMDLLAAAYPRFYANDDGNTEMVLEMWASLFQPYPVELVLAAVKAHIVTDTRGFPPVIGQIMEKIRQITQPEERSEQEAWSLVRRAIGNGIYGSEEEFARLPKDIQAVVHDPAQLRVWAMDGQFNENVVSSNFMRSYRTRMEHVREFQALPQDVQALAARMGGGLALSPGAPEREALPPKSA